MHPRPGTIETVDSDEIKHAEIFKHPIGIILLYIQAGIGMVLAIGLSYFLLPVVLQDNNKAFFIGNVFAAFSVTIAFMVIVIATVIYRQNRLIITDRNITQILQFGLFSRKVSQLNMHNVEDVTAVQDGVLPTIFNYGTLKVETAGEQVNFIFPFCPNAGYYAKIILDAREKILGQMGEDDFKASSHMSKSASKSAASSDKPAATAIKEIGAETIRQAATTPQR